MKVLSEKGGEGIPGNLETLLQELTRCEERSRRHSAESASAGTRQKLLSEQLQQTQEELAAAQASRATLCNEIGTLKQAKDHQAKQLSKYKMDLQASRESQAAMTKKMEELEASTWMAKQQYIRSLASRIKTSALVLQQLHITNGTSLRLPLVEKCASEQSSLNKRKRIRAGAEWENGVANGCSEPKPTECTVASDHESIEDRPFESAALVVAPSTSANRVALVEQQNDSVSCDDAKQHQQQENRCAQSERAVEELQSQIAKLETEFSDLDGKYKTLVLEHDEALVRCKTSAQELKAKQSKIEELLQKLNSKEHEGSAIKNSEKDEDNSALEGRLKMLEENLAQMNGYADQLEMVIAQCPSCTVKLQNESTQDSIGNRAE